MFLSEDGDGGWLASWQDQQRVLDFEGSRAEAMRWARSCQAARILFFSPAANTYVPLEDDE